MRTVENGKDEEGRLAMGILLPYGIEFNKEKVSEYYAELLLPLAGEEIFVNTPMNERADKVVGVIKEMIEKLNKMCGLPTRLRDVGVKIEEFPDIARTALNVGAIVANPVEVEYEDIIQILKKHTRIIISVLSIQTASCITKHTYEIVYFSTVICLSCAIFKFNLMLRDS